MLLGIALVVAVLVGAVLAALRGSFLIATSPAVSSPPPDAPAHWDYTGLIHCHTDYSDGGVSFAGVIYAANHCRLDFIITSDHDTLRPRCDGWEGWHNGTLVMVAEEVSTADGHVLSVGAA